MRDWTVSISWDAAIPVTDDLLGEVAEIGGAAAGEPDRERVDTTLTVEANTPDEAIARGVDRITAVIPGTVVRVEAMTTEEADQVLARPPFPELVGITEIGEMLGVTRQRASALRAHRRFPAPVAVLASGPVWRREDLSTFEAGWSRKSGRPPTVKERRSLDPTDEEAS